MTTKIVIGITTTINPIFINIDRPAKKSFMSSIFFLPTVFGLLIILIGGLLYLAIFKLSFSFPMAY